MLQAFISVANAIGNQYFFIHWQFFLFAEFTYFFILVLMLLIVTR